MHALLDNITIFLILAMAAILIALLSPLFSGPSRDETRALEREERMEEAKIKLLETRIAQIPQQTEGIRQRYRLTQENRINSLIRQQKQELEIAKLRAQVELLRQQLGSSESFNPDL
jgi:hypothetical protein